MTMTAAAQPASTAWLIEHPAGRRWFRLLTSTNGMNLTASPEWCEDPRAALHLAREEDAKACIVMWQAWTVLARATEHVFLPNAVVSGAPADAKE